MNLKFFVIFENSGQRLKTFVNVNILRFARGDASHNATMYIVE